MIAALGAIFAGPSAPAIWLRQRLAPDAERAAGDRLGSRRLRLSAPILWGGTHALRTWWGILLLAALIAIGVVALRRQTLNEFPPGHRLEPAPAGSAPSTNASSSRLQELHEAGTITDEEFVKRAKKIAPT